MKKRAGKILIADILKAVIFCGAASIFIYLMEKEFRVKDYIIAGVLFGGIPFGWQQLYEPDPPRSRTYYASKFIASFVCGFLVMIATIIIDIYRYIDAEK